MNVIFRAAALLLVVFVEAMVHFPLATCAEIVVKNWQKIIGGVKVPQVTLFYCFVKTFNRIVENILLPIATNS
jgi:hypothetical protein